MKSLKGEDSDSGEVEFELSAVGQWVSIGFNNEKNEMVRQWAGNTRKVSLPSLWFFSPLE